MARTQIHVCPIRPSQTAKTRVGGDGDEMNVLEAEVDHFDTAADAQLPATAVALPWRCYVHPDGETYHFAEICGLAILTTLDPFDPRTAIVSAAFLDYINLLSYDTDFTGYDCFFSLIGRNRIGYCFVNHDPKRRTPFWLGKDDNGQKTNLKPLYEYWVFAELFPFHRRLSLDIDRLIGELVLAALRETNEGYRGFPLTPEECLQATDDLQPLNCHSWVLTEAISQVSDVELPWIQYIVAVLWGMIEEYSFTDEDGPVIRGGPHAPVVYIPRPSTPARNTIGFGGILQETLTNLRFMLLLLATMASSLVPMAPGQVHDAQVELGRYSLYLFLSFLVAQAYHTATTIGATQRRIPMSFPHVLLALKVFYFCFVITGGMGIILAVL